MKDSNVPVGYGAWLRAVLFHYWQKAVTLSVGRAYVSSHLSRIRKLFRSDLARGPSVSPKAAVVAHIYYLDLIPEIIDCRDTIHRDVPLHLTVPFDRVAQARQATEGHSGIVIHPCENRGRDVAPFMALLNAGVFDGYDAVLKLHTKRSPHLRDGEIRRKLLFSMLCGSPRIVARVFRAFEEPETGIVGWRSAYRSNPVYWMANRQRVEGLAMSIGAERFVTLGFFEGSMFWFRPKALEGLKTLALAPEDFEAEDRQLDGTLHHAVERIFTIAARARGFVVRDLKGRRLV